MDKAVCRPVIDYMACNICTTCVELCMHRAIYVDQVDGYVRIDYTRCRDCGVCVRVCPYGAVRYLCGNKNQWVPTTSSSISAD